MAADKGIASEFRYSAKAPRPEKGVLRAMRPEEGWVCEAEPARLWLPPPLPGG